MSFSPSLMEKYMRLGLGGWSPPSERAAKKKKPKKFKGTTARQRFEEGTLEERQARRLQEAEAGDATGEAAKYQKPLKTPPGAHMKPLTKEEAEAIEKSLKEVRAKRVSRLLRGNITTDNVTADSGGSGSVMEQVVDEARASRTKEPRWRPPIKVRENKRPEDVRPRAYNRKTNTQQPRLNSIRLWLKLQKKVEAMPVEKPKLRDEEGNPHRLAEKKYVVSEPPHKGGEFHQPVDLYTTSPRGIRVPDKKKVRTYLTPKGQMKAMEQMRRFNKVLDARKRELEKDTPKPYDRKANPPPQPEQQGVVPGPDELNRALSDEAKRGSRGALTPKQQRLLWEVEQRTGPEKLKAVTREYEEKTQKAEQEAANVREQKGKIADRKLQRRDTQWDQYPPKIKETYEFSDREGKSPLTPEQRVTAAARRRVAEVERELPKLIEEGVVDYPKPKHWAPKGRVPDNYKQVQMLKVLESRFGNHEDLKVRTATIRAFLEDPRNNVGMSLKEIQEHAPNLTAAWKERQDWNASKNFTDTYKAEQLPGGKPKPVKHGETVDKEKVYEPDPRNPRRSRLLVRTPVRKDIQGARLAAKYTAVAKNVMERNPAAAQAYLDAAWLASQDSNPETIKAAVAKARGLLDGKNDPTSWGHVASEMDDEVNEVRHAAVPGGTDTPTEKYHKTREWMAEEDPPRKPSMGPTRGENKHKGSSPIAEWERKHPGKKFPARRARPGETIVGWDGNKYVVDKKGNWFVTLEEPVDLDSPSNEGSTAAELRRRAEMTEKGRVENYEYTQPNRDAGKLLPKPKYEYRKDARLNPDGSGVMMAGTTLDQKTIEKLTAQMPPKERERFLQQIEARKRIGRGDRPRKLLTLEGKPAGTWRPINREQGKLFTIQNDLARIGDKAASKKNPAIRALVRDVVQDPQLFARGIPRSMLEDVAKAAGMTKATEWRALMRFVREMGWKVLKRL